MIGTDKIERLIELSLMSGYIKDGTAPLSLNLISYPETAKTKMIIKFSCPHTVETSDLSAKPISDVIIPKLRNDEIHHIVIPDMVKVLSHRETTVNATITFLNTLMEEGIKQNLFFGQMFEFNERKKCGLITAITFDYFYKMFRKWLQIGFTSRFLPVSFEYSKDTVFKINDAIQKNLMFNEIKKMKKIRKTKIEIPNEIASWINLQTGEIVKAQSNESIVVSVRGGKQKRIPIKMYGFRLHRQLRKLSMTIALSDGQKSVNWEHANELKELLDYIRLPKNPKVI